MPSKVFISPSDFIELLKKREWDNSKKLRANLIGEQEYPVKYSIKQVTPNELSGNFRQFIQYLESWKESALHPFIDYQPKIYKIYGSHYIPKYVIFDNYVQILSLLESEERKNYQKLKDAFSQLIEHVSKKPAFIHALSKHHSWLTEATMYEIDSLITCLNHLKAGCGQGNYIRQLNLPNVDTKYVQKNDRILTALLDSLYQQEITGVGSLERWLECKPLPSHFIMVRPLCPKVQAELGGLELLQIDHEMLSRYSLPGKIIIIVENVTSGLALPNIENAIAIAGAGGNISFLKNPIFKEKRVVYWGDIDAKGLAILSDARKLLDSIIPTMMSKEELEHFPDQIVEDTTEAPPQPVNLTPSEFLLYDYLSQDSDTSRLRLEQEKLSMSYIQNKIASITPLTEFNIQTNRLGKMF